MKAWAMAATGAVLLSAAAGAEACRCAPQSMSAYFERADAVLTARLRATHAEGDDVAWDIVPIGRPYKGTVPPRIVTAASTATCGIPGEIGAVYTLFASRRDQRDDTYRVDSCSGTRPLLGDGAGFVDVPPRFVAQQLNGLAGAAHLRAVAARHPDSGDPDNAVLVGLLDLEPLAHGGAVALHAAPEADSPVLARVTVIEAVETAELGYEFAAAVVYARIDGWYRLKLRDGRHAWLAPGQAGTFVPYAELPVRRLAHLTPEWAGFVWPEIGAGLPLRLLPAADGETPVTVHEARRLGGSLWFRVEVLESVCSGSPRRVRATGWVPAYGATGAPTVWYWSRGC